MSTQEDDMTQASAYEADDFIRIVKNRGTTPASQIMARSVLKTYLDTLYLSANLPAGFLFGLTLSNNVTDATNDIDIATGKCRDGADGDSMVRTATLTKRLDAAWAVGSGNGGLDTGAIANNTYHIWLIKRVDTGVVDALFSLSASAPTMPTNYTLKRRIGSIVRTGGAIKPFLQVGDKFSWVTPVYDLNAGVATTATLVALTVPTGVKMEAIVGFAVTSAGAGSNASLFDPDIASSIVANFFPGAAGYVEVIYKVFTNTSAQVKYFKSAGATNVYLQTHGWIDTRGRLA